MPMNWSQDKYIQAYRFAAHCHQGQLVPGMDWPYIIHPSLVSMEVIAALSGEQVYDANLAIQCALLHDVLEDTHATYEQVKQEFGAAVADGVFALSKNKAIPKELQMTDSLRRIQQQPHEIWIVKMADRIINLQPPPPNWTKTKARHYWEEALEIYNALKDANIGLAARLLSKCEEYRCFVE